jgi:acetolactate synthase-1/2/3 large subunit
VLVDVPKDIQQQLGIPDWDAPMAISGYMSRLPPPPEPAQLAAMLKALKGAKKPVSHAHQDEGGQDEGGKRASML